MKLFNYVIEVKLSSLQPWSHFRIHDYDTHKHLVWGRLSIIFGQPHLEIVSCCAVCESPNCREIAAGDEGWTHCPDCNSVEQGYEYMTLEEAEKRGLY